MKKTTIPLCLLALSPLSLAIAAGIEIDGNHSQLHIHNDVPVVNIAAPDQHGVSHNNYKQFNVGNEGLVLNNSTLGGESVLAGQLQANPNLTHSASLIINEVTGNQRSSIDGEIEVFGKQADVLIANPNGISVNGGSFINTPHITLTTGELGFDAVGKLASVTVKGGDISIGRKSLNGNGGQYIDIMTETMKLNGAIQGANELNVTLGQNKINLTNGKVEKLQDIQGAKTLALDSSALGGMYANKIRLVSTQEQGEQLGVNLPQMIAHIDNIEITSDGAVKLNDLTAKNQININANKIFNDVNKENTTIRSQNDITLKVSNKENSDKMYKAGNLYLNRPFYSDNNFFIQTNGNIFIKSPFFWAEKLDLKANNLVIDSDYLTFGKLSYSGHNESGANLVNIDLKGNFLSEAKERANFNFAGINANNISITSPTVNLMDWQLRLDYDAEFGGNDHNEIQRQNMLDNFLNRFDKSNILRARNDIKIVTNDFRTMGGKLLAENDINFSGFPGKRAYILFVPNMLGASSKQDGEHTIMSEKSSKILQPIIKAGNDFTINYARKFEARQASISAGQDIKVTNSHGFNILTNSYDLCTQGACWFFRDNPPQYFQQTELTAGRDILIDISRYRMNYRLPSGSIEMQGAKLNSGRDISLITHDGGIYLSYDFPKIAENRLAMHPGRLNELNSGRNITMKLAGPRDSGTSITLYGPKINAKGDITLSTETETAYFNSGNIHLRSIVYKTTSGEKLFTPQLTADGTINIKTKKGDLINEMAYFKAKANIGGSMIFQPPSWTINHTDL